MFSALETSIGQSPARSWQDIGRAIMHSRITKLAAAVVLVLAVLLLARHLTGRERTVGPGDGNKAAMQGPQRQDVVTPAVIAQDSEQPRFAQELASAQTLFARTDVNGLLRLLDTGLDQTRIAVAGYLAQMGEESALPALQSLAEQWKGTAERNPFQRSIEQIRDAARERSEMAPQSGSQEQTEPGGTAAVPDGSHIVIRVTDKVTGEPVPQVTIRASLGRESQTHATDDQGVSVLDLGASIPDYLRLNVSHEEYVWQDVTLRDRGGEKLPETVRFALEKGVVIGGVVQDSDGHPIDGASVESYSISDQQYQQPCVSVRIEQKTDSEGRWRSGANVPRAIDRLWFNVRHPDFADDGFEMPGDLTFDDLCAERAVMVLDKGLAVSGRVTDMAGNPIAGAKLLAGEDYFARDWTQTDEAGHFEFQHLRPLNRSFLLTVQAPGFAPQRKELPSEKGLAPVEFILEPAKLLIGRVVDAAGEPVEGAYVVSEEWNGYRTVKWQANTDAKGMFVWDYPPDDAVRIRINKSPYREFEQEVVANDLEQTFVLARPVTIKGSVTDSETGKSVNRFKVTPGAHWRGGTKATWQTSEGWVRWFTDGRYSYTFSGDASAYAVRIEADGYVPYESRFVDANELEVTIDVALTKGQGLSGYVFDANAAPVEGAEVFWEKHVYIQDGQMLNRTHRLYVKTDSDGRFTFKPEDRKDPLLAICDRGIGIALYEDFARDGIITLTPWARVVGELRIGTRPAAKKRLQLTGLSRLPGDIQPPVNETTTDEHGWFVFERVYPGEFRLYNETYEVLPGQTLELHLGGTGRTVRGELALPVPSDVPVWADLYLTTMSVPIPFDKYPKPPGYEQMSPKEVEAWLERFGRTTEGQAYADWLAKTYPQTTRSLRVEMDGQRMFHVDNVEPGVYALKGVIRPSPTHDSSRINEIIGRLWREVVVPPFTSEADLDIPLDLGALPVLPGELKPGDPAPDFDVPAFGPGRIRLADYRGKVLLVAFSTWGYMDPDLKTMQDLKVLYQRFRADPQYAQVSLLFAGNPVVTRRAIDEAGLDWPHGSLEWQERVVTEYDVKTAPWNVLIGPQGEILALGLSGESLQQAVEAALGTAQ